MFGFVTPNLERVDIGCVLGFCGGGTDGGCGGGDDEEASEEED